MGERTIASWKIKAELLIKTGIFLRRFFPLICMQKVGFKSFCLRLAVLGIQDQISPDVLLNTTHAFFVVLIARMLYNYAPSIIHQRLEKISFISFVLRAQQVINNTKIIINAWILLQQRLDLYFIASRFTHTKFCSLSETLLCVQLCGKLPRSGQLAFESFCECNYSIKSQ
jgi:hypothetical protein